MATDYPILYEGNLPYIFISYSHKSYEQVYRILHSLNRHGVRFWYDQGLQKGIDWEQHVKDKILAASEVWFFFDKQFFYSPSLITEVSIVDKEHKPYCPIYYEGQMFMQLYRDLPWDVALRTEDERLLNKCFHPKITAVVKGNDSDVFLRELVQEAQKVSAVTAPGSQTMVKSRYAFVSIQDERATAYYEGIAEVLNGSDCKLEQRLVQDDGQDIALSSTLLALAESKPDGVVVRCTAKPGEVVLDSLRRLCQATKVVLLEHDLDEREQIRLGPSCPQFVAADLDKGGACLAGAAMQIALGYGWQDTDVVVCCPPKEAPGYRMGCAVWDAMSGADIRPRYVGGGSNASSTFAAMQGACQTMPSEIGGRSLVLYTGDAELTRYVVEHLDNLQMGRTPASRYAHIILLGYDRKIEDVIKNTPYGYVLLDTMPVLQGAEAARRLLGKAPTSRVGLVAPALQKNKVAPSFCTNKVSTLFPLIDACDIVVDGEGVLTDTTPIWWQIFDELLGKYGIKIEEQDKKHYPVDAGALATKVQHKTGIAIDKATFVQESTKQYAEAWLKYKPTAYPWVKEWAKRYQGRKPVFYTSLSPDTANKVLRHLGVDDMFVPSRRVYSHTGVTIQQVCAASRGVVALFTANPLLAQLADPWGVSTIGIPGRYTRDWDQCTCTLDVGIKKGLFVGLANLDLVFGIDALPPSDSKIATSDYRIAVGGPALSAAITCAKLGGNATLVTGLGNGVLSDVIRQECAQYGVRLVDIMPQKAMLNMSFVALHRNTSTREIVSGQTVESIQTLPDRFFDEFDYCLYDCNYPIYTEKLITALRKADVPLVLDCGAWKENLAPALQYAQYAIASAQFATPDGQDLISMQSKYRLHYAAITHGGEPITYCDRGHTGTIQVDTKTNVLTLGAGDVLHGAFCYYCLDQGLPFVEALRLASQHATHFVAQN